LKLSSDSGPPSSESGQRVSEKDRQALAMRLKLARLDSLTDFLKGMAKSPIFNGEYDTNRLYSDSEQNHLFRNLRDRVRNEHIAGDLEKVFFETALLKVPFLEFRNIPGTDVRAVFELDYFLPTVVKDKYMSLVWLHDLKTRNLHGPFRLVSVNQIPQQWEIRLSADIESISVHLQDFVQIDKDDAYPTPTMGWKIVVNRNSGKINRKKHAFPKS